MAKINKYLEAVEPVVEEKAIVDETIVEEATPEVEEPVKKPRSTKKAPKKGKVFNCGLLNVRENPSTNAKVIKCLPAGTEVEILGTEDEFYKIADGFVMKSFIEC